MTNVDLLGQLQKTGGQAAPTVRISDKAAGSEIAAAQKELISEVRRGAGVLADIGVKQQTDRDKTEAQSLLNEYSKFSLELELGRPAGTAPDGTPTDAVPGFRGFLGQAAGENREAYTTQLIEKRAELEGRATSDRVLRLIASGMSEHEARTTRSISAHTLDQDQKVAKKTREDALVELSQVAAAYYSNSKERDPAINAAYQQAIKNAEEEGLSKESQIRAAKAAVTEIHKVVFNNLVLLDARQAEDYLKLLEKNNVHHREEVKRAKKAGRPVVDSQKHMTIDADALKEMRKDAGTATRDQDAVNDGILLDKSAGGKYDLNISADRLAAQNALTLKYKNDPETLKVARAELARRIGLAKDRSAVALREAGSRAWEHVVGGGTMKDFHTNNQADFKLISQEPTGALMQRLRDGVTKVAQGGRKALHLANSDGESLGKLLADRETLRNLNVNDHIDKLTEEEWGQLKNRQIAAVEAHKELLADAGGPYTKGKVMVRDMAPRLLKNSKVKKDEQAMNELEMDMDAFVRSTIKSTGKAPGQEEYKFEAMRLLLVLVGDPPDTGTGFGQGPFRLEKEGEAAFEEFGFRAEDILHPKQRAIARVPIKTIPQPFIDNLRSAANKARANAKQNLGDIALSDDQLENLAAAVALSDARRIRTILGITAPVRSR